MKKCRRCNELKPLDGYYAHKKMFDGRLNICKECVKLKNSEHRNKNIDKVREYDRNRTYSDGRMRYRRSFNGLSSKIYNSQKSNSKHRGYPAPDYSLEDFRDWLSNQPTFEKRFQDWKDGGYKKDNVPSVDRIDDYKPYTFNNIQLIDWSENDKKAKDDTKKGKLNKRSREVSQYSLDGELINVYNSIRIASICSGVSRAAIGNCINGRSKTSGGYIWK